jgi:CBS domain-containing membrane protein
MTAEMQTIRRNDELSMAQQLMNAGRFRHVVVLDNDEQVVGVISQQDIFYGALSWSLGMGESAHERTLETTPAKAVMNTQVFTTAAEAPIVEAAQLMLRQKIGCLPVLEGPRLVGIVTEADLLAIMR